MHPAPQQNRFEQEELDLAIAKSLEQLEDPEPEPKSAPIPSPRDTLVLLASVGVPAVKAKAAKPVKGEKRFYTVWSGPPALCGIHHQTWKVVEARLPTGRLAGSGCVLKGFDTLEDAAQLWLVQGWKLPAPLYP